MHGKEDEVTSLIEHIESSFEEITATMKLEFAAWQGTNERRDDVTAVEFRL
jgi:hypothetical protein